MQLAHKCPIFRREGHEDGADLVDSVAVGPGKSRHADAHVRAEELAHTLGHFLSHLIAHGSLFLDERRVYAEKL